MLAVACPGCGAPCRVSLERPDLVSCASCGKVGAPPEIARAHLAAAQRVLSQTDERTRQLRGLSRVLAGGAAAAVPMYLVVAALLALWSGAFVHGCQGDELPKYGVAVEWILPAAGAALSLLVALPAFVSITRSARKLHDLASATPPLRAGEPAACRVCGAPVGGAHGVVRCRHCRADNIVDAQVMARAGRRHELEIRDLEAEVRSLTSEIGETRFVGLTFSIALSAFAVPMVAIILGDNALEHANVSLGSGARYVVAEYPGEGDALRTCLHARGGPTHPTYYGQHHPSWIVGKNLVRTDWRGQALQVTGVARNLAFGDVAVIRDAAGARSLVRLDGLCVIGAPPGVAPPAPAPGASFKLPPAASGDAPAFDPVDLCRPWVEFAFGCGIGAPHLDRRHLSREEETRYLKLVDETTARCRERRPPFDEQQIQCYRSAISAVPQGSPASDWSTVGEATDKNCSAYRACAAAARDGGAVAPVP